MAVFGGGDFFEQGEGDFGGGGGVRRGNDFVVDDDLVGLEVSAEGGELFETDGIQLISGGAAIFENAGVAQGKRGDADCGDPFILLCEGVDDGVEFGRIGIGVETGRFEASRDGESIVISDVDCV